MLSAAGCYASSGCGGATYDIDATRTMWAFFMRMAETLPRV